jgi:leucyl aminopeptidase (aminopeptidase T)
MFHEFELGKSADILVNQLMAISGGETLVITADTESDPSVVHAVARSAFAAGGKPMEIWTATPLQSGKAADGFLPSDSIVGALSAADAWLELNKLPILYSRTYERAHKANPKLRHLMLGGMDAAMMTRCIGRTNYPVLSQLLSEIGRRITAAKRVRITSPAGTDIEFANRADWPLFAVDGRANTPGTHTLGGMMAWSPDFPTTHGVIVIDGAVSKIGVDRLGTAITLNVRGGEITSVQGGHEARRYEEWMRSFDHPQMFRLAHTGLGFLPRATLSGIMSEQERIWGCSVWGVGDAAAFLTPPDGFPAPSHNDGISLNCSLWLDDVPVTREGELLDEELRKLAASL